MGVVIASSLYLPKPLDVGSFYWGSALGGLFPQFLPHSSLASIQ